MSDQVRNRIIVASAAVLRDWLPEVGSTDRAHISEALADAAIAQGGGLDVELLIAAYNVVCETPYTLGPEADAEMDEPEWVARGIAAEYARLRDTP